MQGLAAMGEDEESRDALGAYACHNRKMHSAILLRVPLLSHPQCEVQLPDLQQESMLESRHDSMHA
jgi:hypothetical protein